MEIRKDIQFLRGLAVLMVLLFHLQATAFNNGFLGVDVFFVISGFLMAKLYDKGTAIAFYKRRLNRLFPAYVLVILLTLVLGYYLLIPVDFGQLFDQTIAGVFFVSNVFYWNQNSYFDKAAFNPLLNLWSLAVEVQFYLVVPFLYPLIRRRRWLFYAVFLFSLVSCFIIQAVSPKTAFFFMPLRIWEFLIGAWVAWWSVQWCGSKLADSNYIKTFFISILVVFPFFIDLKPDATGTFLLGHPAIPALVVTMLTGLVIAFGMPSGMLKGLVGRFFARIGDYSYSIYLIHFPIIVLLNYIPFGGTRLGSDDYSTLALALILISTLSLLSYYFIEKKFSRVLNHSVSRVVLILFVLSSTFVLSGLNLSKYSDSEKNIFSAWTDRDIYRCGKVFRIFNPTEIVCDVETVVGGKNILLVGNSHADSIKRVFADTASLVGLTTFFVVSNGPLMDGGPNADDLIAAALEHKISALILHFSNIYIDARVRAEILKLIEIAKGHGINVFVIGPVPTYDAHVPKAMFNGVYRLNDYIMSYKEHIEKTRQYRDFVSDFDRLGVSVYDPALLLCPDGDRCLFSSKNLKPYYFDSGHLTLTGASFLVPLFMDMLDRLN